MRFGGIDGELKDGFRWSSKDRRPIFRLLVYVGEGESTTQELLAVVGVREGLEI